MGVDFELERAKHTTNLMLILILSSLLSSGKICAKNNLRIYKERLAQLGRLGRGFC